MITYHLSLASQLHTLYYPDSQFASFNYMNDDVIFSILFDWIHLFCCEWHDNKRKWRPGFDSYFIIKLQKKNFIFFIKKIWWFFFFFLWVSAMTDALERQTAQSFEFEDTLWCACPSSQCSGIAGCASSASETSRTWMRLCGKKWNKVSITFRGNGFFLGKRFPVLELD